MFFYSNATGGFYPADMKQAYEAAGTWPADAIELTADEHAALRSWLDAGKRIAADPDGRPILVDPPLSPIADIKAAALSAIDSAAGAARARYITVVPGQEATYQLKTEEASAYIAAGRPTDTTAYPMLASEASALGVSVSQLADIVVAMRSKWVQLAALIEAQRVSGKLAVEKAAAAGDRDGIASARDAAVAALEAM